MSRTERRKLGGGPHNLGKRRGDGLDQKVHVAKKPRVIQAELSAGNKYNDEIGLNDPHLFSDYFAKLTKRHYRDSSSLELDEKFLPHSAFINTTKFEKTHTLAHFVDFLEAYAGSRTSLTEQVEVASPHTLVICPSALRAGDVCRALQVFRTDDSAIAKVFAKHIKLEMAIESVKKTKIGIAVGTPFRLNSLVEADALKLAGLKRIVIDGSYLDEKKQSIFTMGQVFEPMLTFLNKKEMKSRYDNTDDHVDIIVF